MGAQSLCCVSGGLAWWRLAAYSLVPLHGGCSERGLVLCFRLACCGNVQPSILAWCVLKEWAPAVFQVGVLRLGNIQYPCMGAQSLGWCCVSGGLACCRLATYSLVPLHGCSELGLVLCFRWFGVMKVGSIQPSTLAWWVLRAWAGVVFQVGVL